MEHSYLANDYCKYIISILKDNPKKLVWLCDYHDGKQNTQLTWNKTKQVNSFFMINSFEDDNYWIINHTKKCYIDIKKLKYLYENSKQSTNWNIHPIPILCNSDEYSQGGGDYHTPDSRRATWCEDLISSSKPYKDEFENFKDVTEDCLFFELAVKG